MNEQDNSLHSLFCFAYDAVMSNGSNCEYLQKCPGQKDYKIAIDSDGAFNQPELSIPINVIDCRK